MKSSHPPLELTSLGPGSPKRGVVGTRQAPRLSVDIGRRPRRVALRSMIVASSAHLLLVAQGCSTEPESSDEATAAPVQPPPKPSASIASGAEAANTAKQTPGTQTPGVPAKEPEVTGPRVYAKSRFVWIREFPTSELQWIGFLWTGGSVALKSEKIYYGPGCEHWYAIEPKGYVCVDGHRATLDPADPVLKALTPHAANLDSAWPHQYGESQGLPRLTHLPDAATPSPGGADASAHKATWTVPVETHKLEQNPFIDLQLPGPVYEGRTRLLPRSTVAYSSELKHGDRNYLLAADMTWVPKDRVEPYAKVTFEGVRLSEAVQLPLAFFRGKDRPQYRRKHDAGFEENGQVFRRLSYVQLTGETVTDGDAEFLKVRGQELYVKKSDAVLPTPQAKTPWGTRVGGDDTTGHPEGRATWMEASVWDGWLIAYEGTKPVYVTMISAGRGGTPVPDKDPLETASTPTGTFPISGKFATATMEAPGEFIHSDVPWTQNFSGPHALHGAYWHDDWGKLKSAGCVNVSPKDGRWLYQFTEPVVPKGWHGVRWLPKQGPATLFVVHR